LRDIARGRVTGRLNVNARLEAAGLPAPLTDLVRVTVKRTRLWSLERAELAEELIAHFRDALEAGVREEELRRTFGDPRRVAVLIRRAKKRNRPAPWRYTIATFKTTGLVLGLLLLWYIGYAFYFFAGEPQPSVNYIERVNEPAKSLAESDRAWPLYRKALLQIEPAGELEDRMFDDGSFEDPDVMAYLDRNAEALAIARQAAAKAGLGFVHGELTGADRALWPHIDDPEPSELGENALIEVLLPYLSDLRRLARLLAVDARLAATAGAGERVLADVQAMLGIADHVRESPILINDLVALSALSLAAETTQTILAECPDVHSDDQLQELAHRFAAARDQCDIRYDGERWFFEDVIQRLYTDDGSSDGHMTNEGVRRLSRLIYMPDDADFFGPFDGAVESVLAPFVGLLMASRDEMIAKHDEIMDAFETEARKPLWESNMSALERRLERMKGDPLTRTRYLPLVYLVPALSKSHEVAERGLMQRDVTLVALALELYHRRHGAWPASLDELTPRYLPEVPADRFTGRPLNYALIGNAPAIYSVGTDRDDDGGTPPVDRSGEPNPDRASEWIPLDELRIRRASERAGALPPRQRIPDGDWVLWRRGE
jgi:hypothetical protein